MSIVGQIVASLSLTLSLMVISPFVAASADDAYREQVVGILTHGRVSIDFDQVPLGEALSRFGSAMGLNIIGRYDDQVRGLGFDMDTPITLRLDAVSGLDALEMIIDQGAIYSSCTWQSRNGFVEVGTKRKLGQKTERRLHFIGDFVIEPPYFAGGGGAGVNYRHFNDHPYRSASLKIGRFKERYNPQELTEEFVWAVAEVVEPGNWDFELSKPPPTGLRLGGVDGYHSDDNRIARIRNWQDDQLVIIAPDYFHRQVGGVEAAPPPPMRHFRERSSPQQGVRFVGIEEDSPQSMFTDIAAVPPRWTWMKMVRP